ncbi:MAG: hypothetical protein R2881_09210 [Eubacteriales bacterium]
MRRYEHGGSSCESGEIRLDFSVSINPFGLPCAAKQALVSSVDHFSTYPDCAYGVARRTFEETRHRSGSNPLWKWRIRPDFSHLRCFSRAKALTLRANVFRNTNVLCGSLAERSGICVAQRKRLCGHGTMLLRLTTPSICFFSATQTTRQGNDSGRPITRHSGSMQKNATSCWLSMSAF